MVRLSPERIKELQKLLKEQTGKDYSDEEAQVAGLNIMRFVLVKEQKILLIQADIKSASDVDTELEDFIAYPINYTRAARG